MRDHFDTAHVAISASFFTALAQGWTVQDWAAFAALISSVLVIGTRLFRLYRWVKAWRAKRA